MDRCLIPNEVLEEIYGKKIFRNYQSLIIKENTKNRIIKSLEQSDYSLEQYKGIEDILNGHNKQR